MKDNNTLQDLVLKLEYENDVLWTSNKKLREEYDTLFKDYVHLRKSYYALLAEVDPEWAKEVGYEVVS